ncbi:unnamed protein product, partial [Amoebophrya sp. A120]|eukprot:GSA120T00021036001.1
MMVQQVESSTKMFPLSKRGVAVATTTRRRTVVALISCLFSGIITHFSFRTCSPSSVLLLAEAAEQDEQQKSQIDEETSRDHEHVDGRGGPETPAAPSVPSDDGWTTETKEKKVQYSFGMNWDNFADWITVSTDEDSLDGVSLQHRLNPVIGQLQTDFDLSHFKEKSFLDLGCGSGLLSTAARQLGAKHIVSVDVQPKSLSATHKLRNWAFFRDPHVQGEKGELGITTFEQAYFYKWEMNEVNGASK